MKVDKIKSAFLGVFWVDVISNKVYADNKFVVVMCSKLNTNKIKKAVAVEFNLPYRSCDFLTDDHYEIPEY